MKTTTKMVSEMTDADTLELILSQAIASGDKALFDRIVQADDSAESQADLAALVEGFWR